MLIAYLNLKLNNYFVNNLITIFKIQQQNISVPTEICEAICEVTQKYLLQLQSFLYKNNILKLIIDIIYSSLGD